MKIILLVVTLFFGSCLAGSWVSPWTGPLNTNSAPISNYARHSAVAIPGTRHRDDFSFEVFGMEENLTLPISQSVKHVYTATRKFNIATKTWSLIPVSNGVEPSARGASSIAYVTAGGSRRVFIFGGAGYGFVPSPDPFWNFNLDTNTWTQLSSTGGPGDMLGCALTPYLDGFLLFGGVGFNADFTGFLGHDDLWYYNALTSTWTLVNTTGNKPSSGWFDRIFIRSRDPNTLILIIGEGGDPNTGAVYLGDQYELNLLTLTWSLVTPILPLKRIRAHCAMGLYEGGNSKNDQIVCHSGDYGSCSKNVLCVPSTSAYNIETNEWYDGLVPEYAFEEDLRSKAAQLTCFDDLCIHTGGINGMNCDLTQQRYLNDVYAYNPRNEAFRFAQKYRS